LPLEKVYYYEGNLYFWYNEPDNGIEALKKATTKTAELDLNTALYAWLRLGQCHDMKGQRSEAKKAYERVVALSAESDAAKEARGFLTTPYKRKS
jgi:tetratricopeptide (TPR) repeat protein